MTNLRLFTPGPVPIEKHIRAIGEQALPYNRTEAFSSVTQEILAGLKQLFQTEGSVALLTGSGTAAMEAVVLCLLSAEDKVLVINGGTFGQRWGDLCRTHSVPFSEYSLPAGTDVNLDRLEDFLRTGSYDALLVNAHETSTGHLYDTQALGSIAKRHGVLFVSDAISSLCADPFSMDDWDVDVAVLSSQKALALPPGLSFVAMNARALDRLKSAEARTLYLNLKDYLANQERGQAPYTPAIGLMLQLRQRLLDIQQGTLPALIAEHARRAATLRNSLSGLPFSIFPSRSSNAMTALSCDRHDAVHVVETLRDRYDILVAPNVGSLRSKVFRISHMGAQVRADSELLVSALQSFVGSTERVTTKEVHV